MILIEKDFEYNVFYEEDEEVAKDVVIRSIIRDGIVNIFVSEGVNHYSKLTLGEKNAYDAVINSLSKFKDPTSVRITGTDIFGTDVQVSATNSFGARNNRCYNVFGRSLSEAVFQDSCSTKFTNQALMIEMLEKYLEENY